MEIKGWVAFHGLADWWTKAFSEEETRRIVADHAVFWAGATTETVVLGDEANEDDEEDYDFPLIHLIDGDVTEWLTTETPASFLHGLAEMYPKAENWPIVEKLLTKAEQCALEKNEVLTLHFLYQDMIQRLYRRRNEEGFLERATAACRKQIALAPEAAEAFRQEYRDNELPAHVGFDQLRIILKKQKRWEEHDALCQEAERQGWNGNWKTRGTR